MPAAPAEAPPVAAVRPAPPAPRTVPFPTDGLGEYHMPADAELVTIRTEAEVYQMDLDLIREHWDDLSEDELVEQAVREYAALLGRRHMFSEEMRECERTGSKWNPAPPDDPLVQPVGPDGRPVRN